MTAIDTQGSRELHGSDVLADHQVERLVAEIAGVIRSVEPERRSELKQLAETLLREEISSIAEQSPGMQATIASQRLNPLLPGIFLTLVGFGFFLLFPLVGIALAGIGVVLMVWGAVLSGLRK